jgi:hypothetical protein
MYLSICKRPVLGMYLSICESRKPLYVADHTLYVAITLYVDFMWATLWDVKIVHTKSTYKIDW